MSRLDIIAALQAHADTQPTPTLYGALVLLERPALTEDERMTQAAIFDVIVDRHDLHAAMDVYWDDVDATGTALDALTVALDAAAVTR